MDKVYLLFGITDGLTDVIAVYKERNGAEIVKADIEAGEKSGGYDPSNFWIEEREVYT